MKIKKSVFLLLSIPIILILYYFFFPRFIFIERNIADVSIRQMNIDYTLSFSSTLHERKQNLLFDKSIYGSPFKVMLVIKSPPDKELIIENIQVADSKQNLIFEQDIINDIVWAKQENIWIGTLFYDNEIKLNDIAGTMTIRVELNGQHYEIPFRLKIVESKETCSLFSAGLSI